MQKKYKTKVLSLGTWPTAGSGFKLAVDAWRAFTAGLEPLVHRRMSPLMTTVSRSSWQPHSKRRGKCD